MLRLYIGEQIMKCCIKYGTIFLTFFLGSFTLHAQSNRDVTAAMERALESCVKVDLILFRSVVSQ